MFQQHKRRLSTRTSTNGQSWNQMDYILCIQRWRISIHLAKTRPGDDSDDEHFIDNFRLKLKKVGKTTRPFRYDLNQIPHDYTVKATNRFKGLDLVECLKIYEQRFVTLYRRQWPKPSQRKRNAGSQSGCLRRLYELLKKEKQKAKEKGEDTPHWMQNSREQQGDIRRLS